jgi:hypothetical protein
MSCPCPSDGQAQSFPLSLPLELSLFDYLDMGRRKWVDKLGHRQKKIDPKIIFKG